MIDDFSSGKKPKKKSAFYVQIAKQINPVSSMLIEGIKICVSVKLKYSVKFIKWSVTGKHESPIRHLTGAPNGNFRKISVRKTI